MASCGPHSSPTKQEAALQRTNLPAQAMELGFKWTPWSSYCPFTDHQETFKGCFLQPAGCKKNLPLFSFVYMLFQELTNSNRTHWYPSFHGNRGRGQGSNHSPQEHCKRPWLTNWISLSKYWCRESQGGGQGEGSTHSKPWRRRWGDSGLPPMNTSVRTI